MIAHYVTEHGYLPPPEFVAAVMACPLPGTEEYLAAVAPFANRSSESARSGRSGHSHHPPMQRTEPAGTFLVVREPARCRRGH
jgi:hypothetical protein